MTKSLHRPAQTPLQTTLNQGERTSDGPCLWHQLEQHGQQQMAQLLARLIQRMRSANNLKEDRNEP
jgi:hypothetical protein